MTEFYIKLLVWVAVIGVVFGLLWKFGYLARFAAYVGATRDELRKCSWPTKDELWQSTVLVFIVIGVLGIFTLVVDFGVLKFIRALL